MSVYLSTDAIITPWDDAFQTGDLEIGNVYVSGLAAGGQQTLHDPFNPHRHLLLGSHCGQPEQCR